MGCLKKIASNPIVRIVADVAATASGNPELIPLIHGGTTLASGGSPLDALKSAGIAFAGQELLPVVGNAVKGAFPETAASLGIDKLGGNSLTDLFGQTTGQGSLLGPGTIGGDLMGNFAPGSGLESLFSTTSNGVGSGLTGDFASGLNTSSSLSSPTSQPGYGGASTSDPATDFARFSTASAASPTTAASTLDTGGGISTIGGGTPGGFADFGNGGGTGTITDLFARGLNNPTDTGSIGYSPTEQFTNAAEASLPATAYSPTEGFNLSSDGGNKMSGLTSLFKTSPGVSMLNNLLRTGIMGATTKTNQPGYNLEAEAAKEAAGNYQPFLNTGTQAAKTLADLYGTSGSPAQTTAQDNFRNTPGYQFIRDQGIQALDASAAKRGGLVGGNQYKAIQDYGSGLADTTYNQYVQNLQKQAEQGITAAGGVGTGNIASAGATAEGMAEAAKKRNQITGGLADSLFPNNDILSLIANGGNSGLLSLFM